MPVVSDPSVLSSVALFEGPTTEQLSRLNTLLHRKTFPAGSNLMTAGQTGDVTYVILNGTIN